MQVQSGRLEVDSRLMGDCVSILSLFKAWQEPLYDYMLLLRRQMPIAAFTPRCLRQICQVLNLTMLCVFGCHNTAILSLLGSYADMLLTCQMHAAVFTPRCRCAGCLPFVCYAISLALQHAAAVLLWVVLVYLDAAIEMSVAADISHASTLGKYARHAFRELLLALLSDLL